MTEFLTGELKRTFERATLEHIAKHNLGGDGWQAYRQITERYEHARAELERTYAREYDTRVEVARAALVEDAGIMRREFTPRFGALDRFNPAAINRQAHRSVRHAHEAELSHLDDIKCDALSHMIAALDRPPHPISPSADPQNPRPAHTPASITTSPTRSR